MSKFLEGFEALLSEYGVAAMFVTVLLESFGLPLPGETAIIATATGAALGRFPIETVAIAAFLAAVIGDNIGYLIGRELGRPVILRHGRRIGITEAALARVEDTMRRRGPIIVVIARFVVLLRQLNGLVAGTSRMPWPRFLLANVLGAALWVGVWATLAYRLGREAHVLPWIWHHLGLIAAIVVPGLIVALLLVRVFGRGRR